ncbi:MAG: hypothetical protein ACRDZ2_15000 [Ilumatobacteraceae bacterium]
MDNSSNWEPPRAGSVPPPPSPPAQPGGFGPPADPTAQYPTDPTAPQAATMATLSTPGEQPRGRSGATIAAAIIGVVALVGAGVFAVTRIASGDDDGGADSPEAAGEALLSAVENEDALGVIDVLLPGERETLRGPLIDLVSELRRIEVLSDDADLAAVGGINIELEDEQVAVDETNVDDIVNLQISARATASVDGEALPIGDLLLANDAEPSDLTTEAGEPEPLDLPLTAVRKDGRWYVSAFYTVAEQIRLGMDDAPEIPAEGIAAVGGESPEDAMDNMLEGIEALDLQGIIGSLDPQEFEALQRYAPLFIDDAQSELDQADAAITIDDPEYSVSGSGATRQVGIQYLRMTIDVEDDPGTITLDDGCWIVEAREDSINTCELSGDLSQLEDLFDDPEPVRDLIEAFQSAFDDYENPGFTVKEVDGGWYLSPMSTVAEQLLAVLRAVDRAEIEELIAAVETAVDSNIELDTGDLVPGDDLLDDYTNPNDEDDATVATVVPDDPPTSIDEPTTSSDPAEDCYSETEGEAAAECYQGLVDTGEIDPIEVPVYLRVPECGLADLYWSGDYYDLPDAEFVTVVEEAAPCFQDAVTAGTIGENDIPLELEAPECLQGRNWYAATADDTYYDEFIECASS